MRGVRLRILLPLLFLFCLIGLAGIPRWHTDFEEVKKIAVRYNKLILADFSGSDWCMWCARLEREVFSKRIFQNYAENHFILFVADFPKKKRLPEALKTQNKKLCEQYQVRGFPTVLILNGDGKVLARTGYREGGVSRYVRHLKLLVERATE